MKSSVRAEWDDLKEVVIHRPGIEMFFGLMAPFSFLYERAFSMDEAIREHIGLEQTLASSGVRVHRLKRLAVGMAKENSELLARAREYAVGIVKFSGPRDDVARASREFRNSVGDLDTETIFNILLLRPRVALEEKKGVRVVLPRVTLDVPLANLYFMRDQQAVSDRGVMMGRMSKPQRRLEPLITGAVLEMAGAKTVCRVKPPGTFEGGDFMPAGDFAMLGLGDRSNRSGVSQILAKGLGFDEVVKVNAFYQGGASAETLHRNLAIRSACFTEPGPATTGIPLPFLAYETMVIEIEVVAMEGEGGFIRRKKLPSPFVREREATDPLSRFAGEGGPIA